MDLKALVESGHRVQYLVQGAAIGQEVDVAIQYLVAKGEWRLLGEMLLTASEVSGYRILDCLMDNEQYEVVALVACLRRQLARRSMAQQRRGVAKRVFRDFDESEEDAHIPSEIVAEAEEISQAADRSRDAADRRESELDRDPMRDRIVNRLAEKLVASERAMEALVTVARASAFEDTRRGAALKLGNSAASVRKLAEAGRTGDLVAIAQASALASVARNISKAMTDQDVTKVRANDTPALELLAKHHPDESVRHKAKEALSR